MVTRHVTRHPVEDSREGTAPTPTQEGTAWVRVTAVGGVVFFALVVCFGLLSSNTPAATDPRDEVFRNIADHQDRLQLAAVAYGLAMPAALLFLCGLFAALRKAEGRARIAVAVLSGGILAAAASVSAAWVLGVLATRLGDLGLGLTRVLWTMVLLSVGATLLGHTLMLGGTAAVAMRRPVLPRWLASAAAVLAVASVVGAFTIGYVAAGIQVVAGVTLVLNSAWMLAVSIHLWRHPDVAVP
jgi:hypothetical protein